MKIQLATISLSILLLGCSSTPESSIENMYEALQDGNFLKFAKYTNDPVTRIYSVKALSTCSVDKSSYKDGDFSLLNDCFLEKYNNLDFKNIKISNLSEKKADAELIVIEDQTETLYKFTLRKGKDNWRVTYPRK